MVYKVQEVPFVFVNQTSDEFDAFFSQKVKFPNEEGAWKETPLINALEASVQKCTDLKACIDATYAECKGNPTGNSQVLEENTAIYYSNYNRLKELHTIATASIAKFNEAILKFQMHERVTGQCKGLENEKCAERVKAVYLRDGERMQKWTQALGTALETRGWVGYYLLDSLKCLNDLLSQHSRNRDVESLFKTCGKS